MAEACADIELFAFVSFAVLGSLSQLSYGLLAFVYFKDKFMSRPPGSLIAIGQLVCFIYALTYLSSWPFLRDYFIQNSLYSCSISSFVSVYGLSCAWSYYLCTNIELHIRIRRPNSKGYFVSPTIYLAICQTIGLSAAVLYSLDSQPQWDYDQGCGFNSTGVAGFYVTALICVIILASAVLSTGTLYLMWRARQFTNYFAVHTVWTLVIVAANVISLLLQTLFDHCTGVYIQMLLTGLSGLVAFVSRIVDRDFRLAFYATVVAWKQEELDFSLISCTEQASIISLNFRLQASKELEITYRSVFEKLHLKFILDSLIALTFYFTRACFQDCYGVSMKQGATENVYSIDAEFIKEVVQVDRFNAYFDQFTAAKYVLVDYSPQLFRQLRERAGINDQTLMLSLNPFDNLARLESLSKVKGGSSGAFIYLSHDKRFLIKTISAEEKIVMLSLLLPSYLERQFSGSTALVRILGVYLIQCVGSYSTNVVIMENASSCRQLLSVFDLKGSIHDRRSYTNSKVGVRKDCNFIDEVGSINLKPGDAARLQSMLRQDVLALARLNIMDYSLLVTLCKGQVPDFISPQYIYHSTEEDSFYLIALIDILQVYNLQKKAETFWKNKVKRVRLDTLSAVEAKMYAERFLRFVSSLMEEGRGY
jgi:hypothetical protein